MVVVTGVERLLRLRLAYYSLGDPNSSNFGTRQPLLAKNDILYRFLNAKTSMRFDSSFSMQNKKGTLMSTFSVLVGVTGVEPAASTSQMWRATSCATPRSMQFSPALVLYNIFLCLSTYFFIYFYKIIKIYYIFILKSYFAYFRSVFPLLIIVDKHFNMFA